MTDRMLDDAVVTGTSPERSHDEPADPSDADRPVRPLGISLLIWLYWFWAGAVVLLLLTLGFGEGPVMLNGRAAPRDQVVLTVLPALGTIGLAVIGAALALTFARPWSRAAALFPFALAAFTPALTGSSMADLALSLAALLPIAIVLGWYLYFRPGPRAYFAPGQFVSPATRGERTSSAETEG